jgi:hypothetical protein
MLIFSSKFVFTNAQYRWSEFSAAFKIFPHILLLYTEENAAKV